MAKPISAAALAKFANDDVRVPMGVGALAWKYTILVPVEEVSFTGERRTLATVDDLETLRGVLCDSFLGLSILPPIQGHGLRDPLNPTSLEINKNIPFVVYASPTSLSDKYFEHLQTELQKCLDQGVILIERQEVFLLKADVIPSLA